MQTDEIKYFEEFFKRINNQICWDAGAGRCLGSWIMFKIGKPMLRLRPIKNDLLKETSRLYYSQYSLSVPDMDWFIMKDRDILVSSSDDLEYMCLAITKIFFEQKKIINTRFDPLNFNFTIFFENGYKFEASKEDGKSFNYDVIAYHENEIIEFSADVDARRIKIEKESET